MFGLGATTTLSATERVMVNAQLTRGECSPQIAALVFAATNNPRALDWYFPIIHILDPAEIASFYQRVEEITRRPEFDLQLIGEQRANLTVQMPGGVSQLVAGHLAEVFFIRENRRFYFFSFERPWEPHVTIPDA